MISSTTGNVVGVTPWIDHSQVKKAEAAATAAKWAVSQTMEPLKLR